MKKLIIASALSFAAITIANAATVNTPVSSLKDSSFLQSDSSFLQSDSSFLQSDSSFALRQDSASSLQTKTDSLQQDKTPVKAEDLPAAIKTKLADDHFKEWTLTSAFSVAATPAYYELNLTKGTETKTIKLDKDGKKVD